MLYPNPTKNSFSVKLNNVEDVKVFDLNGTLVEEFVPSDVYDISVLSSGIYVVSIVTPDGVSTQRLVKE